MKRLIRGAALCLALAGSVLFVGWVGFELGHRSLQSKHVEPEVALPVTVVAKSGTLIDEVPVTITAEWEHGPGIVNRLAGTVTWSRFTRDLPSTVSPGDVLYSVDENRVIAMSGAVPAYRALGPGLTGPDVQQLQDFLVLAGYAATPSDGTWRASTTDAYARWRSDHQLPQRRTVALGEIAFVDALPASVVGSESLVVGAVISDGSEILFRLPDAPRLTFRLARASPAIEPGTIASGTFGGIDVPLVVGLSTLVGEDRIVLLDARGDDRIWAANVPVVAPTQWVGAVIRGGPVSGVVVPVAALLTGPDSTILVRTGAGVDRVVTVVLEVAGLAVVEGVEDGEVLLLGLPALPAGAA